LIIIVSGFLESVVLLVADVDGAHFKVRDVGVINVKAKVLSIRVIRENV
jgi:hypothetical protein